MKKHILVIIAAIGAALMSGCSSNVKVAEWETSVKQDMLKDLVCYKAADIISNVDEAAITNALTALIEEEGEEELDKDEKDIALFLTTLAMGFDGGSGIKAAGAVLLAYIRQMDSYKDIAGISDVMLKALNDDVDDEFVPTGLFEICLARILQDEFAPIIDKIDLKAPKFVKRSEYHITWSVYCPFYDEYYALTAYTGDETPSYKWDFTKNVGEM